MKIPALISVVFAGRQVRDAQSLYDKMIEDNNEQARESKFPKTRSLWNILAIYLINSGMVRF